ncbi:MAG: serine/threonine-protein kinase [Acidobacteria bacterium]|nr:serine/threonine-protein kinase [Acidobacteriota bacterium]
MRLTPGSRIGRFEIIGPLGAGGMGEVYHARDPRLDRHVAIKVLPTGQATDPGALARFEHEALSVAKLSHPNILAIHEFGRDGETVFVVTELVDGETLRARLAGGPLPPRRAVACALQIARGMAAAHSRGIVHRDLKPENVMVTRDDQVKILDFGLAKSVAPMEAEVTQGVGAATDAGIVVGTVGYMAPEQVRGHAIDHRTDMFSFGAMLHEMLCGVRAFKGETAADTMTAVLTREPRELDVERLAISPGLDRIVRRCLEKTPELRFQSANDLAFALETLSTASASTSAAVPAADLPRRSPAVWLPWTVAAIAVAGALSSWWLRPVPQAPEPPRHFFTRITEAAGEETSPDLAPDGSTVAYSVRVNGSWDIYTQRVGGRKAAAILNDPQRDEAGPAFSPDGLLIAFHESDTLGGIFVAGATGESVRRITDAGFDPAWSPDGNQIAFTTEEIVDPSSRQDESTLYVVALGGGVPRKLVDEDAVQPSWSPSGERIVFWSNIAGQRDIYTVAAGGGGRVALTNDPALDWSPAWSPDGRFVYFSSDRGGAMNLWRVSVDQSSGRARGAPEPVTVGVPAAAALSRFSKDGSRLVFRSRIGSINPVAIPFDPANLRAGAPSLLDTRNIIRVPSDVSPDGKQVAYSSIGERQEDLFIGSAREIRQVTDDPSRDRAPIFTPDGRSLVFYSNRDGKWGAWSVGIDGGNLRKIEGATLGTIYPQISPKGDAIAYSGDTGRGVFLLPLQSKPGSTETQLPRTQTEGRHFVPTGWSPDGSRLTGQLLSDAGRPSGVGVYDLRTLTLTMAATDATYAVKWLADSRRVIYFTKNGAELVVLDTSTSKRTVVDVHLPGPSTSDMFAISPDNRTIYYGAARAEADIWIVERK